MDPLNDMCDALLSIKNILQKRKQTIGDTDIKATIHETVINSQTNSSSVSKMYLQILTEENFHCAHLYNRSIDELPNISNDDVKQLKAANLYTMQDLLGRFLLHDSPEEFHRFLIKAIHLNETTASNNYVSISSMDKI